MAKETRCMKQYKVFTLVALELEERKDMSPIEHHTEVAVFDDRDIAVAYAEASGTLEYELREEWREQEPNQSQFSLPFNPVFEGIEAQLSEVEAMLPKEEEPKAEVTSDSEQTQ